MDVCEQGSDDRRILLWQCEVIKSRKNIKPCQLKTEHLSNIFCLSFDSAKTSIFSAGNDEHMLQHDISNGNLIRRYFFHEPVYAIDTPIDGEEICATASESGMVELIDTRDPTKRFKLASSRGSYHGVSINPVDSQIVATANSIDGVLVYDRRFHKVPLLNFGSKKNRNESKGFMSVRFNYTGRKLLALQRKKVPILYDIMNPDNKIHFAKDKYENMVTMKSGCFAGDKDQFVVSGSDNFSIYIWRIPEHSEEMVDESPYMVLNGHRSIVNQVRYNKHSCLLASSGVEKVVKVWSHFPMIDCDGDLYNKETINKRKPYSHDEYLELTSQLGVQMSHNYDTQSTDEDPRMIAFFDSLIERNQFNNESDSSDSEDTLGKVENILDILLSRYEQRRGDESDDSNMSNDNSHETSAIFGTSLEELRRIFRSNRTNTEVAQSTNENIDSNNEYDPHRPNNCDVPILGDNGPTQSSSFTDTCKNRDTESACSSTSSSQVNNSTCIETILILSNSSNNKSSKIMQTKSTSSANLLGATSSVQTNLSNENTGSSSSQRQSNCSQNTSAQIEKNISPLPSNEHISKEVSEDNTEENGRSPSNDFKKCSKKIYKRNYRRREDR